MNVPGEAVPSTVATAGEKQWVKGQSINGHLKKNYSGRTCEGHHLEVVTSHELDIHRFPQSRRIRGPCYVAIASLLENLSRTRSRRRGISQHSQAHRQNESSEGTTRKHCRSVGGEVKKNKEWEVEVKRRGATKII